MADRKVWRKLMIAGLLVVPIVIGVGCQQQSAQQTAAEKPAAPAMDHAAIVKRGEYLVTVGGCNDCHTPLKMGPQGPEPDMSRMLSGHPDSFPIASGIAPASDR